MVSDGEVESCPKRARHKPDDHYGRVGRALFLYSPGLGAHSGRHLWASRACWTLSGFVSGRSPAVNGPPVLVTWPSVGLLLLFPPSSPGASGGTGPRWGGGGGGGGGEGGGGGYWVAGHGGKFRRSGGIFENG